MYERFFYIYAVIVWCIVYRLFVVVVSCFCSTQMTTAPTQNKKMIVMSYFVKCGVRQ